MKNAQNKAITRCYQNGIAISRRDFGEFVRIYNNYEMPISKRILLIARGWDDKFFEFLKEKNNMMCYKGTTFCPFYLECANGNDCRAALTPKVEEDAKKWWNGDNPPIAVYLDKPDCFKENDK